METMRECCSISCSHGLSQPPIPKRWGVRTEGKKTNCLSNCPSVRLAGWSWNAFGKSALSPSLPLNGLLAGSAPSHLLLFSRLRSSSSCALVILQSLLNQLLISWNWWARCVWMCPCPVPTLLSYTRIATLTHTFPLLWRKEKLRPSKWRGERKVEHQRKVFRGESNWMKIGKARIGRKGKIKKEGE